jgi:hypothetical protein
MGCDPDILEKMSFIVPRRFAPLDEFDIILKYVRITTHVLYQYFEIWNHSYLIPSYKITWSIKHRHPNNEFLSTKNAKCESTLKYLKVY